MRAFSVLSWNIHGAVGRDGRFDLSRVAAVIAAAHPDVATLQEVGEVHGRMPAIDQARLLGEMTGMNWRFMANLTHGIRRYGNAILSPHPILFSHQYDLTVGKREPRGCLRVDLDLGEGAQVHVLNLHLGLGLRERRRQAMLLSADILRDAALAFPLVVAGDFNRWMPGPVRALLRRALSDVAHLLGRQEPTYPARLPLFRLDRVLVDDGARPSRIAVLRGGDASVASDHLPLWVELEVGARARAQPETGASLPQA